MELTDSGLDFSIEMLDRRTLDMIVKLKKACSLAEDVTMKRTENRRKLKSSRLTHAVALSSLLLTTSRRWGAAAASSRFGGMFASQRRSHPPPHSQARSDEHLSRFPPSSRPGPESIRLDRRRYRPEWRTAWASASVPEPNGAPTSRADTAGFQSVCSGGQPWQLIHTGCRPGSQPRVPLPRTATIRPHDFVRSQTRTSASASWRSLQRRPAQPTRCAGRIGSRSRGPHRDPPRTETKPPQSRTGYRPVAGIRESKILRRRHPPSAQRCPTGINSDKKRHPPPATVRATAVAANRAARANQSAKNRFGNSSCTWNSLTPSRIAADSSGPMHSVRRPARWWFTLPRQTCCPTGIVTASTPIPAANQPAAAFHSAHRMVESSASEFPARVGASTPSQCPARLTLGIQTAAQANTSPEGTPDAASVQPGRLTCRAYQ